MSRLAISIVMRVLFRLRVEGRDRLPAGPAVYCFNHLSWLDPFLLYATLPWRPRLYFLGPIEADLRVGTRNRLIGWTATAIPVHPDRRNLREATRSAHAVLATGGVLAIAGEGRIHVGERAMLELQDGPAYIALREDVPVVPIAINGLSWLDLRRTLRVRVGRPISVSERPTAQAVQRLTRTVREELLALVADAPDPSPPGRFGRWLTELFNDWPEGSRQAAEAAASGILGDETRAP